MTPLFASMALAIAYAGFVTLSLAMDRHQVQLLGRELQPRQTLLLRVAGGVLLAGSLLVCIAVGSTSLGIVWWLGLLSLAGIALGLLLAYRPHWARPIGVAALVAAIVGFIVTSAAGWGSGAAGG